MTDEWVRRVEHEDACWDGCDDLHDDVCDCGDPECPGEEWGEEYWDSPAARTVVTVDTGGLT